MKARFNLGDVIVALPVEYLDQQTCSTSVFSDVPAKMVDIRALIEANGTNRDIRWYRMGDDCLHLNIPTDLIHWED